MERFSDNQSKPDRIAASQVAPRAARPAWVAEEIKKGMI
jgi:hypothetical protein